MSHAARTAIALGLILISPRLAAAQGREAVQAPPRIEFGATAGQLLWMGSNSEPRLSPVGAGVRVGVAVTRRWRIEGLMDLAGMDEDSVGGLCAFQIRWSPIGMTASGIEPFVVAGTTGWYSRRSWPESRWVDPGTGQVDVTPAQTSVEFLPPVFPRVGIGVQKSIGSRAAVRAELTTIVVGSHVFITPILHPSVSVTIPLGRYRKVGR
jgi:hypothetical protein